MAQKLDINTYTLQNGEKIADINTDRFKTFMQSFESTLTAEHKYASQEEYENLLNLHTEMEKAYNEWEKSGSYNNLQNAFMQFDDYSRFVASNHWDTGRGNYYEFWGDYDFRGNYLNYDEWRNDNITTLDDNGRILYEFPERLINKHGSPNSPKGSDLLKELERIQANGGMSEAAMEADIAAQENPKPDYLDDKGNPHWFDEEEETEVLSDEEIERLKELNNENSNNSLEQTSLDKASELLKGIQFTPENYKKLIKIINDISELHESNKVQIPAKEQEEKETESIKLFDPDVPIDFGKTVLPAFAVLANGKLRSVENARIMSFDKINQTYLVANYTESFELPKETFESLYLKTENQNIEKKINTTYSSGRAIVFANKEKGIKGTVIPEFSMFTQRKLETFKDYVPLKYNQTDDTYTLSNGNSEIKVTAEQFKEITSPERFNNSFDENTPAWKKLCKQQYKDFFELRGNTAYNFHHNLAVLCRKEANSPCDAIHLAKRIISNMSKQEQNQTKKMFKSLTKNCSINEMIATIYNNSIKEQPLNEEFIKKYYPNDIIARPFYDVITENGKKIENDPALIKNDTDRNLSIGSFIENININCENIFGKGKSSLHFDKLKIIAASKENNTITVMDSKKSYIKLPRDTVLNVYKTQQINEMKKEQHRKNKTINVSSYA